MSHKLDLITLITYSWLILSRIFIFIKNFLSGTASKIVHEKSGLMMMTIIILIMIMITMMIIKIMIMMIIILIMMMMTITLLIIIMITMMIT